VIQRSTVVVADRLAYHRVRFDAAVGSAHGRKVTTLAGLAARLAGPLQQVADEVTVRRALSQIPVEELDSLASVAELPGFARAAAATLQSAWHADLDIAGLAQQHGGRWRDIGLLERTVRERLPAGVSTPRRIVERALSRVEFAPRITGDVTLDGLDAIPPVYRPLLSELSRHVNVRWLGRREEPGTPLPEGVQYGAPCAKTPTLSRVACADPHHEVVEALRWARRLLASGAAKPSEIAIAAASQEQYEDAMLALSAEANLPLHSAGGISALADRDGQLAAALADVLVRGIDRHRVRRLVSLGRSSRRGAERLAALPDHWLQALPEDAPLTTPERWARGLAPKGDELDAVREVLRDLGADLAGGTSAAGEVGERWLRGRARQLWRRALDEGPAQAIDVSLARLRVDDGVDPAAAIVWASASALAGSPRPFVRLLGLASRSWPRRSGEDPLLPGHVLGSVVLHEQSLAERDRRSFRAIIRRVASEVVFSRAKRDAEGRRLAPSPLLRQVDAGDEGELLPRRLPEHAFSEADRRLARPDELASDPIAVDALSTWRAWFSERLTPQDGLVRADHPAVVRALQRVHSATSLRALLRNPIGFVWLYALGWRTPSDLVEELTLDALERGDLLDQVLDATVAELEAGTGLASASEAEIAAAADRAVGSVAEAWAIERPVPPQVLWSAVLTETRDLAVVALTLPLTPLDGQRSYVELPFGDVRAEKIPDAPWDPRAEVRVGESDLRILGRIDRLDLSADGRNARVVDYKSSRKTGEPAERAVDIDEGKELQRCLYGYAVRHLLGQETEVEATLVYPATRRSLPMRDPEDSLRGLELAVSAAAQRLREGYAVLGPDTLEDWFESKLALPADLRRGYYTRKLEELERAREPIGAILKAGPGELREELA
jgi:hypothetical protein